MAIYNTPDALWQVSVDNRLQGLQVQVSFWNGEDFEIRYEAYVIGESLFEAITDALTASGMYWETAEYTANNWGIFAPDSDEEEN